MVRNYKRKPGSCTRNPRLHKYRVKAAVRLRGEGLSLRQTAERLGISHQTVARDLAEWDRENANVSLLPVTNSPPGGQFVTPECDSDSTVVQLRPRKPA